MIDAFSFDNKGKIHVCKEHNRKKKLIKEQFSPGKASSSLKFIHQFDESRLFVVSYKYKQNPVRSSQWPFQCFDMLFCGLSLD